MPIKSNRYSDTSPRRQFLFESAAAASLLHSPGLLQAAQQSVKSNSTKSVIYVFLSGGLAQQDSFDMKPDAPSEVRGEFSPISTATPGTHLCEHLPHLAKRSQLWSLVRSLSHPYNEHSQGHMVMLSGRSDLPTGFDPSRPKPTDHPSIAAIVGSLLPDTGSLPPAMVLPERLIHRTGRVIPGQFAGVMGTHREPHFLAACRFNGLSYGAWPEYGFHHQKGPKLDETLKFQTPILTPPEGLSTIRAQKRLDFLKQIDDSKGRFNKLIETESFRRYQDRAKTLLTDKKIRETFNVVDAPSEELDRYGRNTFGWSLLLAKRLIHEGVRFVQVNLGNNETWDTHGNAFPNLKNYLFPPFDLSLSALLDDLERDGKLEETLVVVAGEFGRTPKISHLANAYDLPGRDHWGAVQTALVAGGGIPGGQVLGSSDDQGGYPATDKQTPENLAATIYNTLGFSRDAHWYDLSQRPIPLYHAEPFAFS